METLREVVAQLKTNDVKQEQTRDGVLRAVKLLQESLDLEKRSKLDALEDNREKKNQGKRENVKTRGSAVADSLGLAGLGGISGLLASVAALGAAFAGLRGWEVRAIKEISQTIPNFIKRFDGGVTRLVNATLKRLGFFGDMERDAKGKFTTGKAETPLTRITRGINDFVKNALQKVEDIFKVFKLQPIKLDDRSSKTLTLVKNVFGAAGKAGTGIIATTLKPIIFLLDDIGKVITGIGAFIGKESADIVTKLAKNVGGFAGTIGKVLKPIGFIFSFVEGIQEAFKTEGDIFDKLTAGLSRFVADFIGAPLNLLKDLSGFLLKQLGFENVSKKLKEFDIEEALFSFVNGAFKFLKAIFTGDLKGAVNILKDFFSTIGKSILKGVSALFGLDIDTRTDEEKATDKLTEAQTELSDINKQVAEAEKALVEAKKAAEAEGSSFRERLTATQAKNTLDRLVYQQGLREKEVEEQEAKLAALRPPEVKRPEDTAAELRARELVTAGGPPNRDIVMAPDQRDQSSTSVSHLAASYPQGDSIDTHSNFATRLAGD